MGSEISAALGSRTFQTKIVIGLYCPDTDNTILKLDSTNSKLVYSYKDGNIQDLDALLGFGWDVREVKPGQCHIVTLSLKCASNWTSMTWSM
jgi:hypothetical protein